MNLTQLSLLILLITLLIAILIFFYQTIKKKAENHINLTFCPKCGYQSFDSKEKTGQIFYSGSGSQYKLKCTTCNYTFNFFPTARNKVDFKKITEKLKSKYKKGN
jgi:C4-type Zn-finger protein